MNIPRESSEEISALNGGVERNRVAAIVSGLFANQSGWHVGTDDDARATILAGADAEDDCAVIRIEGDCDLVFGSDYVRGSKFLLYEKGLIGNYDIGWYLAAANFSDVAAMGARPLLFLSVIRYPKEMTDAGFLEVINGIADSCSAVGAQNVGGDIGGAERLFLSGSAVGIIETGKSLLRSGCRPGDVIWVSGPTGLAGAALRYFHQVNSETRLSSVDEGRLLVPWKRAYARVNLGRALSRCGRVTSCADTSDGLKGALECLAAESSVGFVIEEDRLPVDSLVSEVAKLLGEDEIEIVLGNSVDFQLVFTSSEDDVDLIGSLLSGVDQDCRPIGFATAELGLHLRDSSGSRPLPGTPWRQ